MQRTCAMLCASVLVSAAAHGQNVFVDPSSDANWLGFMNVFNLPADGGAFQFGSPWGVSDLVATFDDPNNTLTLSPNTIGDPDPYWYQGGGGPGAPGNKIMEANLYQEVGDGSLSGVNVVFSGVVLSNSFTQAHEATIFIRDFAPGFGSFTESSVPVTPGAFSISLMTDAGAGRTVQWGFMVRGENVWITDTAPFGNVVIQTIPSPAAAALLGLSGLVAQRRRRIA